MGEEGARRPTQAAGREPPARARPSFRQTSRRVGAVSRRRRAPSALEARGGAGRRRTGDDAARGRGCLVRVDRGRRSAAGGRRGHAGSLATVVRCPSARRHGRGGELIDVVLTERWPIWRVRNALTDRLPAGWRLVDLFDVWLAGPPLAGRVVAADYRIELASDPDPAGLDAHRDRTTVRRPIASTAPEGRRHRDVRPSPAPGEDIAVVPVLRRSSGRGHASIRSSARTTRRG